MEQVMASNVQKRPEGVACPGVNETSVVGSGASGSLDAVDAKNGSDTPKAPNPWPAEYGWDFPFDFPKRAR
jgi:hypothetical protein